MWMRRSIYWWNWEINAWKNKGTRHIRLGHTQNTAVMEHVNDTGHIPTWIKIKFIDNNTNTIPFLDMSVTRDSHSLLTTSLYRKPTHTGQYLACDSHHPQSVKRAIVKCWHDRAKHLLRKPSELSRRRRNTCHHFLFLMDILLLLWKRLQRLGSQQPIKNPSRSFNQLRFYHDIF